MKKVIVKLVRSVLTYLYNISMRRKIMYSYVLFIVLMLGILFVLIYHVTAQKLYDQNSYSLQQGFSQTQAYLSYKLETLKSTSDIAISSSTLNTILNENTSKYTKIEFAYRARTLKLFMKSLQESHEIRRACIYVSDDWEYIMDDLNILSMSKAKDSLWWDSLFRKKGIRLFVGSNYLEDKAAYATKTISMFRVMYTMNNYSKVAFILRLDMRKEALVDILYSADLTNDSITFLMDENNILVASSAKENNLDGNAIDQLQRYPDNQIKRIRLSGRNYMLLKGNITGTNWDMVTLVPYASFTLSSQQLLEMMLVIAAVILFLAFIMSRVSAYTITRRIFRLCRHMERNQSGKLTEIYGPENHDEIGTLYKYYNRMIKQINKLLKDNYHMGQELKNAEYMALQSQINPHFLYNTLDMINWLSYCKKSDEISTAVYALTNFYKLSLSKGRSVITIGDELRHVEYYMEIQSMRFQKDISFKTDVDEELLQYSIPKITLQPIVENALFHGIMEKEIPEGNILITGSREEDGSIHIIVSDDGVGITEELLPRIMDKHISGNGKHYGLFNIDSRMKFRYGEVYGLRITSKPGQGTLVHIRIPAVYIFDAEAGRE